ncbi:hypothetical protein RHMOL_Rhmol07G0021800 [Rhododendron molle]|uniref:Uncharacterized protein n=2 Tax=Rhododendron molle TaxID=49168 RepID=A0ACC0MVY4_RHOML|nr:hypothetical protein RHMOL_Rhmol07G0021800 [Rhododendron molle]KAI8545182.1 hypothetical protein RHMOL_Rhmol07G0021800 [Rhododendron molle]
MAVLGAAGGGALKLLRCFSPDEVPWRRASKFKMHFMNNKEATYVDQPWENIS